MMKGVVEVGTARKAQALGRPAAGKTGTSTNYRDAWFFGFTPELLCGVWVGRDDFKPIGHDVTGGQAALPIWLDFMQLGPARPSGARLPRAGRRASWPGQPRDRRCPPPPTAPKSRLIPFRRGTLPPAFRNPLCSWPFLRRVFLTASCPRPCPPVPITSE